jgi:hypothetical protein
MISYRSRVASFFRKSKVLSQIGNSLGSLCHYHLIRIDVISSAPSLPQRSLEDSMQTPESSVEALANRVAKLESQNRRLKKTGIVALLFAAAVIVMGQANTDHTIDARGFVLKDEASNVRATLFVDADGVTRFTLRDAKGDFHTVLSAGPGQPGLKISDTSVSLSEKAAVLGAGGLGLKMFGPSGTIAINPDGNQGGPTLRMEDKEGYASVLGGTDLITPKTGKTEHTSAATLTLFGKDGMVLWTAPSR